MVCNIDAEAGGVLEHSDNSGDEEESTGVGDHSLHRGWPQGDALTSTRFTLYLDPIAWKMRATEGSKLLRPTSLIATHILYIDDLKAFRASESKLTRIRKGFFFCKGRNGVPAFE